MSSLIQAIEEKRNVLRKEIVAELTELEDEIIESIALTGRFVLELDPKYVSFLTKSFLAEMYPTQFECKIEKSTLILTYLEQVPKNSSFIDLNGKDDEPTIFSDEKSEWRNSNGELHRDDDLPARIWTNGHKEWFKNGQRHRDGDNPAIIYPSARSPSKSWWKNGLCHRDGDLPAQIDGLDRRTEKWYINGILHRDNDEPAIIYQDGTCEWYRHGQKYVPAQPKYVKILDRPIIYPDQKKEWRENNRLHRDNDLPAVIWPDGSEWWFKTGYLHRDGDKPAVVNKDGTQIWYIYDGKHRDNDLPAIILPNGRKEWWKNGKRHRDKDLPAVVENELQEWWKDNLRYDPA